MKWKTVVDLSGRYTFQRATFVGGSYDGNILVNAFACGIARTDKLFYGRASGVGFYLGEAE